MMFVPYLGIWFHTTGDYVLKDFQLK
jgi:hypothetical protein